MKAIDSLVTFGVGAALGSCAAILYYNVTITENRTVDITHDGEVDNVSRLRDAVVRAIAEVETGGRVVVGRNGEVGPLQIRPIMVADVNRILGRNVYTIEDAEDMHKATVMFWIYAEHYSRGDTIEVIARRWNGGPTGDTKDATLPYWIKVRDALQRLGAAGQQNAGCW